MEALEATGAFADVDDQSGPSSVAHGGGFHQHSPAQQMNPDQTNLVNLTQLDLDHQMNG